MVLKNRTLNQRLRMKVRNWFIIGVLLACMPMVAADIGVFAGTLSNPPSGNLGLSVGLGIPVPYVNIEFEFFNILEDKQRALSGALRFKYRFSHVAPYLCLGVGTRFQKLTLKFNQYNHFTLFGGGVFLYLMDFMTMRLDARFYTGSPNTRIRLTGGIFLSF